MAGGPGNGGAINNGGSGGRLSLTLSVVAGNTAAGNGPDIAGALNTDGGGNVIGKTDGITGFTPTSSDRTGTVASPLSPVLGALASNGGTEQTFALLPGSPAIDLLACPGTLITDARGVSRPQGTLCDAGAYEARAFTTGTFTGGSQQANLNTAFASGVGLTVTGTSGDPVAGGLITFTITPNNGASATFTGTTTGCTVTGGVVAVCTIGSGGVVSSPTFTANGTLGGFTIAATAGGVPTVTFTETNVTVLVLSPTVIQNAGPGVPYSQQITATGGSGSGYTYSLASGSTLPSGLTLNSSTGVLSGMTPSTAGSYTFTVQVTDSVNTVASQTYTLAVAVPNATPAPAPTRTVTGGGTVTPIPATHAPAPTVVPATGTPLPQPVRH